MAGKIEKTDKQEGREMGWHGLTEVKKLIELAKCWLSDWDINFVQSFIRNPFFDPATVKPSIITADMPDTWTEYLPDPDGYGRFQATDDKSIIIGKPITDTYGAISNQVFLSMIDDALKGTPHEIWSVGSVRNRGRVFVSVKLAQDFVRKIGHREFKDYLNFGNSHDLSSPLFINNTGVCTVCDNTFTQNLYTAAKAQVITGNEEIADATNLQVRHSRNAIKRLPEIAKLLDKALGVRAEFYAALGEMENVPMSSDTAREVFAGFEGKALRTDTVLVNGTAVTGTKGLSTRTLNKVARLTGLFTDEAKGTRGDLPSNGGVNRTQNDP